MLKIIACDDDVAFLDRLHRMIDRWSTETGTAVDVALVTRGEDLLARHAASRADIILLDMIMPLVNGMDTARELRQADTAVRLVFLTSSPEFALESYEVRAFDYLLKPVTYERLAQLLDELSSMRPAATDELVIKTSFGYHALRLSDIEYAEARNKHVVFHLRDGRDIEALESFGGADRKLDRGAVRTGGSHVQQGEGRALPPGDGGRHGADRRREVRGGLGGRGQEVGDGAPPAQLHRGAL